MTACQQIIVYGVPLYVLICIAVYKVLTMFNDCDFCQGEKGLAIPIWLHFKRKKIVEMNPGIDESKFIGPKCLRKLTSEKETGSTDPDSNEGTS